MSEEVVNDNLLLIVGESSAGKSFSLRNLKPSEEVLYLNCESGKKLPFRENFQKYTITNPYQVHEAFEALAAEKIKAKAVVVDTLTYLMDMFESMFIYQSANGQAAWSDFQQFFKTMMQTHVASCASDVIFLAHTSSTYDEANMMMRSSVPIKGALKGNGIESYFGQVIAAKKMTLLDLKPYMEGNTKLNITPREEMLGFKHVFQTQLTKGTVGDRIRGPHDMWTDAETFIDNDTQMVMDHIRAYYG